MTDIVSVTQELKPCPFCGSPAELGVVTEGGEANPDFGGHYAQCTNERCHGCMGLRFACGDDPRPELVAAWNIRAAEQSRASTPAVDRVLIWSGEHHAYWRPNSAGYTIDGLAAGIYPRAEAERIVKGCDPEKRVEIREINPAWPIVATVAGPAEVLPCVSLVSRQHDPDCGCPEEEYDTPWGYLFLHLSAGKRSEASLDMGDDGEREIAIIAPTIEAARAILFAWAAMPDAISDLARAP